MEIVHALKRDYVPDMDDNDGGQIYSWLLDFAEHVERASAPPPSSETAMVLTLPQQVEQIVLDAAKRIAAHIHSYEQRKVTIRTAVHDALAAMSRDRGCVETSGFDSEPWPEAISDGLTLACGICGQRPHFDYMVTDGVWNDLVPQELRLGVVCLSCLDGLAVRAGADIADAIASVQFTGIGKTVVLKPTRIHRYTPHVRSCESTPGVFGQSPPSPQPSSETTKE
jgi:hypothetical protein